jgi:hypothetical protein
MPADPRTSREFRKRRSSPRAEARAFAVIPPPVQARYAGERVSQPVSPQRSPGSPIPPRPRRRGQRHNDTDKSSLGEYPSKRPLHAVAQVTPEADRGEQYAGGPSHAKADNGIVCQYRRRSSLIFTDLHNFQRREKENGRQPERQRHRRPRHCVRDDRRALSHRQKDIH